jgi:thiosulfate dehydrogenase (quinone) large subunit
MASYKILSLTGLRVALGGLFFYAGITKVANPDWSAAGYLKGAENFTGFFSWLASPQILPLTNFLNEWGLTLLGISLILGIFVRLSAPLGAAMMVLYYVALSFPFPNEHAFIFDEHIVYALALLVLASQHAGRHYGLDAVIKSRFS